MLSLVVMRQTMVKDDEVRCLNLLQRQEWYLKYPMISLIGECQNLNCCLNEKCHLRMGGRGVGGSVPDEVDDSIHYNPLLQKTSVLLAFLAKSGGAFLRRSNFFRIPGTSL